MVDLSGMKTLSLKKIDESTKIVQLLTEGSKNDWLFAIMDIIVSCGVIL